MKNLKNLSKKAISFCELSNINSVKVKSLIKTKTFAFQRCESKREMKDNGVSEEYPNVVWNPYNIEITK